MRKEAWIPDWHKSSNPVNRIVAARYTSAALVALAAYDGASGHFVQAAAELGVGAVGWKLAEQWEKSSIDEASSEAYRICRLKDFMSRIGILTSTIRTYAPEEAEIGTPEDWRTTWQTHTALMDHIQRTTQSDINVLSKNGLKRIPWGQMQQYDPFIAGKRVQGYRVHKKDAWRHPVSYDVQPRYIAIYCDLLPTDIPIGCDPPSMDINIAVVSDNATLNDFFILTWRGYNDAMGDISYTHVREHKMVSASAQLSHQDRFWEVCEGGIVPTTRGLAAWGGYANLRGEQYGLPHTWNKTAIVGANSFLALFGKQRDERASIL